MIETFNFKHLPPAHDDCTVNAYIYVENDENYNFSNHFRHNWTNRCESSYKKKNNDLRTIKSQFYDSNAYNILDTITVTSSWL